MITIRKSEDRGHRDHGWLDTRFTFSFSDYYDKEHMGFRTLRVINEDYVSPGEGFGKHPHRDMEIITYPVAGAIEHQDSTGGSSVIRRGDVQRMTAGSGIMHSEFNHSKDERLHLLQIWILPARAGLEPGYEQETFSEEQKRGRLCLVASPDGRDGSLTIHQDARIYASLLSKGDTLTHPVDAGRHLWIQLIHGSIELLGETLSAGDGAAISDEQAVEIKASEDAELIVFDLA